MSVQICGEEASRQALDLHLPAADWKFSIVTTSMTGTGPAQKHAPLPTEGQTVSDMIGFADPRTLTCYNALFHSLVTVVANFKPQPHVLSSGQGEESLE